MLSLSAALQTHAGSFDRLSVLTRPRHVLVCTAALAIAGYLFALMVSVPARTVLPLIDARGIVADATGTVWSGQARLSAGHVFGWRFMPAAALGSASAVWDIQLENSDTLLTARLHARPGELRVETLSGVAGWSVLALADGPEDTQCDLTVRITDGRVLLSRSALILEGTGHAPPSTCRTAGDGRTELPAFNASAQPEGAQSRIVIRDRANAAEPLGELVIGPDGAISMRLTSSGAWLLQEAS